MWVISSILILCCTNIIASAEELRSQHIPILNDDRTQTSYGEYTFEYQTGNGITRQEVGTQNDGQVANGGWRYTSPEGIPIEIVFVADQGGFQPQGAAIPVPPPLPYLRSGN